MTDTKYNGWTNWETWLTNLHFDDHFNDRAQEAWASAQADGILGREEVVILTLADGIKETVEEYCAGSLKDSNPFVADIISGFISTVNFFEIARQYF